MSLEPTLGHTPAPMLIVLVLFWILAILSQQHRAEATGWGDEWDQDT